MEMTLTSILFVAVVFAAFAWAIWMGYKGVTAEAPEFHEGGHGIGDEGTYDPHCHIGDKSCDELRKAKAA